MKRNADRPLLKVTLNVYKEDWEKLMLYHRQLGPSRVTRELVHAHVRRIEERVAQVSRPLSQLEIDGLV